MNNIDEIIDSNNDLIGGDTIPKNSSGFETRIDGTTDNNVKQNRQLHTNDLIGSLGYFMFPFYESENPLDKNNEDNDVISEITNLLRKNRLKKLHEYYKNPNKLKVEYRKLVGGDVDNYDGEVTEKICEVLKKHFKNKIESYNSTKEIVEEKLVLKNENEFSVSKKNDDLLDKKLVKILDLLKKLDKSEINKLITILGEYVNG